VSGSERCFLMNVASSGELEAAFPPQLGGEHGAVLRLARSEEKRAPSPCGDGHVEAVPPGDAGARAAAVSLATTTGRSFRRRAAWIENEGRPHTLKALEMQYM
jgi:hypothetical protein